MTSVFVVLTAIVLLAVILAHAAILVHLASRKPRWRALVALLIPPLAPYWAWQEGIRAVVYAWGVAVVLYAVGVALVTR